VMAYGIFPSVLLTGDAHASLSLIMALFLLFSAPFWYLLVVSFYKTPSRGWRAIFLPFLGGILVGMVSITITLGLITRTAFSMNMPELFRWAWFRGPGLPMILTVSLLLVKYWRSPTSYSRIREIAGWLSGTAFVYLFWYAVKPDPGFDFYRIFFSPFLWMAVSGSVAWLLDRGLRTDSWLKYILIVAAAVFSSLITLIPVLYSSGAVFNSFVIVLVLTLASLFLIVLDSRGRF